MQTSFGSKVKELREAHFPGESLRSVSEKVRPKSNFFTYLSKIEAGIAKPSKKFLYEINDAYKLSKEEFNDLLTSYLATEIKEDWPELLNNNGDVLMGQLFRKIKNNKKNEN